MDNKNEFKVKRLVVAYVNIRATYLRWGFYESEAWLFQMTLLWKWSMWMIWNWADIFGIVRRWLDMDRVTGHWRGRWAPLPATVILVFSLRVDLELLVCDSPRLFQTTRVKELNGRFISVVQDGYLFSTM